MKYVGSNMFHIAKVLIHGNEILLFFSWDQKKISSCRMMFVMVKLCVMIRVDGWNGTYPDDGKC